MSGHPAREHMRRAVEALATGTGTIQSRLQAAEPYFGRVEQEEMRTRPEQHLFLRIGAGLVEGGDDPDGTVAESIAALAEERAAQIAGDMLSLYELIGGLRSDDGYGTSS